jgi:sugar lactone lactonase YvrE
MMQPLLTIPKPSRIWGFIAIVAVSMAPAALAQVPAVGFTYQTNGGGLGSVAGATDYNGVTGHVAANSRGDVFFDLAACTGTACATINNTYLGELPAGSTSSSSIVSLITGMTSGNGGHAAYVDSANNVWVADTGDGQILFVPFSNGAYPASIAHSAMSNCGAFPVPASTTVSCIVPLNYPSSLGSYIQAADVALDGAGNLYLISKFVGGSPATQYNMLVEFNTSNAASILVTGLSNQVSAEFAVDKAGNIYYEDGTNVSYYAAGSSTAVSMGSGYSSPSGISIDSGGNVYLTDSGNKRIVEFPNVSGTVSLASQFTLASNFNCNYGGGLSQGVGIDGLGNLYYGSSYPNGYCALRTSFYDAGTINSYYANSGNELDMNFHSAVTLGSFALAGAEAASFNVNSTTASSSPSTCTAGSYAAGSSCKLYVNYYYNSSSAYFVTGPQSAAIEALDGSGNVLGSATLATYGSAPGLNIDPGTVTAIGSSWSGPAGIAVDGAGTTYIANAGNGSIYKSVGGAAPTVVASGFNNPTAVAVDGGGNLYVADAGEVVEVPYSNSAYGTKVQLISGLSGASGLALTDRGYLYVADSGSGRVLVLSQLTRTGSQAIGTVVGSVAGTFSIPVAVAVDNLGNLFVSDAGTGKLYKIVLSSSVQTTLLSGLNTAAGVGVDEGGSVFIADSGAETITRIPSIAGTLTPSSATILAPPVTSPSGLAVDAAGNLYVTDPSNDTVAKDNRNIGALNFGNVTASSVSAPLTATLTNAGIGTLYGYYQLTLTGTGTANFTENTSTSTCYKTSNNMNNISQGASCTYIVTYAPPSAVGAQTYGVGISSSSANDGSLGQSLNVSATGVSATAVTITGASSAVYGATTPYTVTASTAGTYSVSITGTATATASVTIASGTGNFNLPALGVGSYTLSVTVNSVTGTKSIVVTPASLTMTATSITRAFDVANPALTVSYSGFANGDGASVVTGTPSIASLATRVSPAAIYQIVPSVGTATAANYAIDSFVDGTLTVTGSALQTVFFPSVPNFTHGATTYTLTGFSTSGLPLTYSVLSGPATISGSTLTVTGTGTVNIQASQPGNSSYAAATSVTRSFSAQ